MLSGKTRGVEHHRGEYLLAAGAVLVAAVFARLLQPLTTLIAYQLILAVITLVTLAWGRGPGFVGLLVGAAASAYLLHQSDASGGLIRWGLFTSLATALTCVTSTIRASLSSALHSEQSYRQLFDYSAIGTAQVALDGSLIRINSKLCEITGYSEAELAHMTIYELTHPDDREAERLRYERLQSGATATFSREKRYIRKDGTMATVHVTSTPLQDKRGRVTSVISTVLDMTEQRAAQAASERSESILNQAGKMARLGAWQIDFVKQDDVNANPLTWSDEVYRIFGYEPGGVTVTNELFFERVHPDDRAKIADAVGQAIKERRSYSVEHRIVRVDGAERVVLEHGEISFDAQGRPMRIVGAVQDITESKRIEAELVSARVAADSANRAKDEFLSILSHELRTPLTAMLGWVKLLRSGRADASDVERGLEVIERNTEAQGRLIEDLLDVSRAITGKIVLDLKPIKLADIVDGALDAFRPQLETKSLAVERAFQDHDAVVYADPDRLRQVISNLMINAIKFSAPGGIISVSLYREAGMARIEIADDGVGIEPNFLPHVFERFRQADSSLVRKFQGLGLGLAIVKHLASLHGGTVEAHSAGVGKGAAFVVKLPLVADGKMVQAPITRKKFTDPRALKSLTGLRVLIVEDEPDAREILARMLGGYGLVLRTAASVREAMELVPEFGPQVIVSDIGLPREDGYQLLGKVQALFAETGVAPPVIALTAYARPEDRQRALAEGFRAHLAKPVDPGLLLETIIGVTREVDRGEQPWRA